ncbi:MmgE/PrpD family protein [Rhodobacteraceae bacterium 2CG4]|uniref:MmgE/PrpD family protein n=1 Tax=Halovulum marinum TaxID=2662447 RepID=A0A6L5Z4K5_9RHOB|nr:MmgE/PrpD family protein [Halovulum marinum]MSU90962.1 MmgE/PrpD family protein [Halovulum marinum]
MTLTDEVLDLAALPDDAIPDEVLALGRASLLDWLCCGRAGVAEPLADKLRAFAASEGGTPVASVFGAGRAPARMAALVNGATSHALDYDDTHFDHVGHLSVGIYPAALAVGEAEGRSATEVVSAFVLGAEAAIRVGRVLGAAHYNRGFHQTATAGAFGATVAAGRLMRLERAAMRAALGLCATRASGLKSQFGTMGKPYNAGIAAANGVECAALARLGLTSADDGLSGPQGFVPTHSDAPDEASAPPPFRFAANKYKFHACCHGTHAMIEALLAAGAGQAVPAGDVAAIELRTNPRWLRVCDIKAPRTGLEVKFSYAWLAGMVLSGLRTGDDRVFVDALAGDPDLAAFARKVTVAGDDSLTDMQAAGVLTLTDGRTIPLAHDLDAPLPVAELTARLQAKARAVLDDGAAPLLAALAGADALTAADLGALVRAGRLEGDAHERA